MQLQQLSPSPARRLASRMLLAVLVCSSAAVALAARADSTAPEAAEYMVDLSIKFPGGEASPKVLARGGEPFTVRTDVAGAMWEWVVTIQATGADQVLVRSVVSKDGKVMGKPAVLAALGQSTGVQSGGDLADSFNLGIKVVRSASRR
jgi:hypothetical protein